jgi:hypothetical protein
MKCRDFDHFMNMGPGDALRTPEALEHLRQCQDCRTLAELLNEGRKPAVILDQKVREIQAKISTNLKPVRPLAPARFFLLACAIIFLLVVAIGVRPSAMTGWDALGLWQRVALFAALTASAMLLAVSMVAQMAPGSKYPLAPRAVPIATLSALLIALAVSFHVEAEQNFVANGLMCMKSGLTYAIPAAFLFWLLVRKGAILYPKLIGTMAGGLAGLIGLSVLEINCSNLNVFHILVWHWGVVLISSAAGALLGGAMEFVERRFSQRF